MSIEKIRGPEMVRSWRWRQKPRLSQAALAELVDCDGSVIRHYEARRKPISLSLSIELAMVTGIRLEHLISPESLRTVRAASAMLRRGEGPPEAA